MAQQKPSEIRFSEINTDIADESLAPGMYRDALNIDVYSDGNKGVVTNLKGNLKIPFTLPEGRNVTIGRKEDTENNKFYFLNWNEEGFHAVYQYDVLLNNVTKIFENLTDTGNIDVLKFEEKALIHHIDIRQGTLYWSQGLNKPRKLNIAKCLDKSEKGYGFTILEEYLNAYKPAPLFAPQVSYFTDTVKLTNYLYGKRFKATVRHIFADFEKSNFSEFSIVPDPTGESIFGSAAISNLNNGLKIVVETGSLDVKQIEIGLRINNLDFVSIAILDKKRLGIANNTTYEYSFYNDNVSYSGLVQQDVNRAYSFMPDRPELQAYTNNAMIYGDGEEGFEVVEPVIETSVNYSDLFLPSGTTNELNNPYFAQTYFDYIYSRKGEGRRRWSDVQIKVGVDVKKGNKFQLYGNDDEGSTFYAEYTATISDDATSVASYFQNKLFATGSVQDAPELLPVRDIWAKEVDGLGNVSFRFVWKGAFDANPMQFGVNTRVNPVSVATLKDTGESIGSQKSGGSVKYGIIYWNDDTKRSNAYTNEAAVVRNQFVTETSGYKSIVHEISVKHQPPIWAKYWELVRTVDLTYGNDYIHVLIQKAIESQSTTNTEYVDLVIGSLFTYQKMYPNSTLKYNFEKNDRIRLIRKEDEVVAGAGGYYPFLETVVLDYKDFSEEVKSENVTTNGTNSVVIDGVTSADNIGRYIEVNGTQRLITAVTNGTTYQLDRSLKFTDTVEFPNYKIIDLRGIIRVRKPVGITIQDNSLIEIYKPTQNIQKAQKEFFLFGKKYSIINAGTAQRSHAGNIQNQDPLNLATTPAIIQISKGTSYVRGRALPTNNSIPGTQVIVDYIEDKSYSDFYESDLNDNGKVAPEDTGQGVIRFGDRLRFSSNAIEDTRINNLNDFNNTDREDYNDIYGKFKLIKYKDRLLYAFKELRTGYIPVLANIIQDQNGNELLGTSAKLLNQLKYFSFNGGIGNNPESYAESDTWMFFASTNAGTFCRTGGDGILPISEQFGLNKKTRVLFEASQKYGTRIFGGYDKETNKYIPVFEKYKEYLYNAGFTEANWNLYLPELDEDTIYEITTQPVNGFITITPENLFSYVPNTDFVGDDPFFYRYMEPGGSWSLPKKECIKVVEPVIIPAAITYYNTELTTPFTKNNCVSGTGTIVNYVVPAFKYNSVFSQDDADAQATADAAVNGQAFANTNGTCVVVDPLIQLTLKLELNYLDSYFNNTGLGSVEFTFDDTTSILFSVPSILDRGIEGNYNLSDFVGKTLVSVSAFPYLRPMESGETRRFLYYNGTIIKSMDSNGGNGTGSDLQINQVFFLDTPILIAEGDDFKIRFLKRTGIYLGSSNPSFGEIQYSLNGGTTQNLSGTLNALERVDMNVGDTINYNLISNPEFVKISYLETAGLPSVSRGGGSYTKTDEIDFYAFLFRSKNVLNQYLHVFNNQFTVSQFNISTYDTNAKQATFNDFTPDIGRTLTRVAGTGTAYVITDGGTTLNISATESITFEANKSYAFFILP